MKRFTMAIAIVCLLTPSAFGGDIPCDVTAPGEVPTVGLVGEIPSTGLLGDVPSVGLTQADEGFVAGSWQFSAS